MHEIQNKIFDLLNENTETLSIILNPEEQSKIKDNHAMYIEFFNSPLYERLSVYENLKFHKKWHHSNIDLEELMRLFNLTHVKDTRAKNIEHNDYVMTKIAISYLQNNAQIMLIEPLQKLHTETIKTLIKVMTDMTSHGKKLCLIFSQMTHSIIVTDNVYRYQNEVFNKIEVDEEKNDQQNLLEGFRIIVKVEDKTIFIKPEEIDYIEAQEGKSYINVQGESYRSDYTMKTLEERLKPYGFFRCHRSYIINLQKVAETITWSKNSYSIKLQRGGDNYIPLSRQKVSELNKLFTTE